MRRSDEIAFVLDREDSFRQILNTGYNHMKAAYIGLLYNVIDLKTLSSVVIKASEQVPMPIDCDHEKVRAMCTAQTHEMLDAFIAGLHHQACANKRRQFIYDIIKLNERQYSGFMLQGQYMTW